MMQHTETVADVVTEQATERIVDRLYVLQERLGEGGMGTVYRATQRLSGQDVALKLIYGDTVTHDADTLKPDSRPTTNPALRPPKEFSCGSPWSASSRCWPPCIIRTSCAS